MGKTTLRLFGAEGAEVFLGTGDGLNLSSDGPSDFNVKSGENFLLGLSGTGTVATPASGGSGGTPGMVDQHAAIIAEHATIMERLDALEAAIAAIVQSAGDSSPGDSSVGDSSPA